jgi:hypothetical protein
MPGRLLIACCLAAVLSACADRSTSAMGAAAASCHAAGAQALLGRRLDQQVMDQALRRSGGLRSRVVPAGAAMTAGDADPMRLNIELDADGRIHRMRCG